MSKEQNEELRAFYRKTSELIASAINDNEEIANTIENFRQKGYNVGLLLEIGILVGEDHSASRSVSQPKVFVRDGEAIPELFNSEADEKFKKKFRIKI